MVCKSIAIIAKIIPKIAQMFNISHVTSSVKRLELRIETNFLAPG
jgi:hypothetical protein